MLSSIIVPHKACFSVVLILRRDRGGRNVELEQRTMFHIGQTRVGPLSNMLRTDSFLKRTARIAAAFGRLLLDPLVRTVALRDPFFCCAAYVPALLSFLVMMLAIGRCPRSATILQLTVEYYK